MMLKSLPKFLLAAFTLFLFQNLKAQNETEPNNTAATANTLALNGSGKGIINPAGDVDWWKVKTNGDGQLTVTLTPLSNKDTYVQLYDTLGTILLASGFSSNVFSISADGLAKGTYYLKVFCSNSTDTVSYTISNTFTQAALANDVEPNNSKVQADVLALNDSTTGHVGYYYNNHRDTTDWYKVTTNADGLLRLTLNPVDGQDTYVTLYDHDGTTVLNQGFYHSAFSISTDGLGAGTYYVNIICVSPNTGFTPYVLSDSLFTYNIANDVEPNNSKVQADVLALNDSTTGHVGYYYDHYRDTTDWYKVTTNADGLLRLTLNPVDGQDTYVTLYDHDGTTVLNQGFYHSAFSISTDGLGAGTYYVNIICSSPNTGFTPYVLSDSLFTYSNANDQEPNNQPYLAKTLTANAASPGHVGFYYNNVRDTTDWFKINYTGTGALSVTLNLEPTKLYGGQDTYMQIYADTSSSPIYSGFGSNLFTANLSSLAQGYYYVKIFELSIGRFESYTLTPTFTQVNIAQISVNAGKTLINGACTNDSITYNLSASHSPYTVRFYKNGALYDSTITIAATVTFSGLSAGNYYATVYGDGATDAAYSKSATSTVVPPVPTGLATTNIGVHTATLNWAKISCANYYKIQYRIVGNQTWTVINTTGDTSKLALTGLQPYTLYAWEVASVDTTKGLTFTSAFSDSVTFRTLSDTAHIALIFKGSGSGCNNDTLRYKATNSASPYTVTLYRNGIAYGSPLSVKDTASFYNVPPGNYYAKATGTGSGGSFGLSDTTQIVPPVPTGLDTADVTTAMATLNWDAVSCANYYTVEYRVTGTKMWAMVSAGTNNLMLTGLAPGTKYTWRVSASDSFNNQTVTGIYSDSAFFTTQSILPVTFISFNGVLQNNSALLSWSTAAEINNKGYEVEKSFDGAGFSDIGFVKGAGNSSGINNYSYTDIKVTSGSNYYRLKQIDNDGRFTYSSVIKIDYSKFDWSILGNPFSGNTWLQLQLDKQAHVAVQIISINGKAIQLIDKGNLTAGTYSIPLNLNNVSSGIYIVQLTVNDKSYTTKLMK